MHTRFLSRTEREGTQSRTADAHVTVDGTKVLLHPLTARANVWVAENLQSAARYCFGAVVISRHVEDIVSGMRDEGLVVT